MGRLSSAIILVLATYLSSPTSLLTVTKAGSAASTTS